MGTMFGFASAAVLTPINEEKYDGIPAAPGVVSVHLASAMRAFIALSCQRSAHLLIVRIARRMRMRLRGLSGVLHQDVCGVGLNMASGNRPTKALPKDAIAHPSGSIRSSTGARALRPMETRDEQ